MAGDSDDRDVTDQNNASPVDGLAPFARIVIEELMFPLPLDAPGAHAENPPDSPPAPMQVDECAFQVVLEIEFLRQHDFEIIGRMEREFMVLSVAGPEPVDVVLAEEGEDGAEDT